MAKYVSFAKPNIVRITYEQSDKIRDVECEILDELTKVFGIKIYDLEIVDCIVDGKLKRMIKEAYKLVGEPIAIYDPLMPVRYGISFATFFYVSLQCKYSLKHFF